MQNRECVIEKNIGLVHSCARKFRERGIEYEDIFQSGCIGLIKAVDGFDENRGVKFSTYAVPVILGEIKTLFRKNGSIKVGRRLRELSIKIKHVCEEFVLKNSRSPTINEISESLGIDTEQTLQALDVSKMPVSLTSDDDEGEDTQIDIPVEFDEEGIYNRLSIMSAMETFEIRDKKLIYLRFFKGITQSQTAKILGMTQVQVSRREKLLLSAMRVRLS